MEPTTVTANELLSFVGWVDYYKKLDPRVRQFVVENIFCEGRQPQPVIIQQPAEPIVIRDAARVLEKDTPLKAPKAKNRSGKPEVASAAKPQVEKQHENLATAAESEVPADVSKHSRGRSVGFTKEEIEYFEKEYAKCHRPTKEQYEEIAKTLKLRRQQVVGWFGNKRRLTKGARTLKRKSKKGKGKTAKTKIASATAVVEKAPLPTDAPLKSLIGKVESGSGPLNDSGIVTENVQLIVETEV